MSLNLHSHCDRHRLAKSLVLTVVVAAVGTFLIPADAGAQNLPAHDAAQTTQHNALTGQATAHDGAQTSQHDALTGQATTHNDAQTTQHNALTGQVTTHDGAQTDQHNALTGQATTHNDAQTTQHNALTGQVTTHDAAQTTQHDALSQQISNISAGADHSGLLPSWDKTLPANDPGGPCPANSSRFTCVMGGAAVRDNETGLVWEQSPATTTHIWGAARFQCTSTTVGGRKGWRLPSLHELASLVDLNNPGGNPALPSGHPFTNVQSTTYWSATTNAATPSEAWDVNLSDGAAGTNGKTLSIPVWCVRGGMNADQY